MFLNICLFIFLIVCIACYSVGFVLWFRIPEKVEKLIPWTDASYNGPAAQTGQSGEDGYVNEMERHEAGKQM